MAINGVLFDLSSMGQERHERLQREATPEVQPSAGDAAKRCSPGSQICLTTARGDIALITINEYGDVDSPSYYVNIDLTVWRGAVQAD